MYVGLKQPRGDGERYVTPARAAAKETNLSRDETKLLFSFFLILFNYAIQGKFITWLVNSALNCTWKPISHSSLRDSCDIGFRVQFNAEFPRQVMNFPIEFMLPLNFLEGAYQDGKSWSKSSGEKTLMTRLFFDKGAFLF